MQGREKPEIAKDYNSHAYFFISNSHKNEKTTYRCLRVKFLKGKLVKFSCDENTDLVDALTQKYGEPESTDSHIKFECIYNLTGITRTLIEYNYFKSWYNGPIIAFDYSGEKYDDHCKAIPNGYFDFSIPTPAIDKWEDTESYNAKQSNKPKPDLKDL